MQHRGRRELFSQQTRSRSFQRVRIAFDKEIELPKRFWIALDFNAGQTKGVYVSYDTSTKGQHSRVGLAGDDKDPKNTDFAGDWMIQVMLAPPPNEK